MKERYYCKEGMKLKERSEVFAHRFELRLLVMSVATSLLALHGGLQGCSRFKRPPPSPFFNTRDLGRLGVDAGLAENTTQ